MAKNRVTPDSSNKPKDHFFSRPQSKFKSKINTSQDKQCLNSDIKNKTRLTKGESIKPNLKNSDFFLKPSGKGARKEGYQKPKTNNIKTDKLKSNKKPFDKKKYRLQKYSNKYKVQQWEDKRNKAVLRGYYRSLKEDEQKLDVKQIYEEHKSEIDSEGENTEERMRDEENENNLNASISQNSQNTSTLEEKVILPKNSKGKKNKAFKKAHLEFQRIKEEKQKKKEELLKKKAEKKEALQEYKRKKVEKYKKLSRKTKRGQPIMKDRIEMLLEKIQNSK